MLIFLMLSCATTNSDKTNTASRQAEKAVEKSTDAAKSETSATQVENNKPVGITGDPKLIKAFSDLVMTHNATMSFNAETGIKDLKDNKEHWDRDFFVQVSEHLEARSKQESNFRHLHSAADKYAKVVEALRQASLPEVFAGIPFIESRYKADLTSVMCAAGEWQFMPETAKRIGLNVKDCKLEGSTDLWAPTRQAPAAVKDNPYVKSADGKFSCQIANEGRCGVDERFNFEKSTAGAIKLLKETWNDSELQKSGSIVQLTILAHNAGHDDSKFGEELKKSTNILPSYRAYMKKRAENSPEFLGAAYEKNGSSYYGDNILCEKDDETKNNVSDTCEGLLASQTQHYGYQVVANHLLAVCFYTQNHGDNPTFSAWKKYNEESGYCSDLKTPTLAELGVQ